MKWPSEKVWFSSSHPNEPQESHSKSQKGRLGRLTNALPTLCPLTCWTAMLELHDICLSVTEEREFQEPRTSRGLLTTLLQDWWIAQVGTIWWSISGGSPEVQGDFRELEVTCQRTGCSQSYTYYIWKLPSSSTSLSVEVSSQNLWTSTRSCKPFVCTLAVTPPSYVSSY